MRKLIFIFLAFSCLSGCKYFDRKNANKIAVAKVGDKVLYEEDFNDIFNAIENPEDSLKLRDNYIQKWIRDEVLFLNALNNLTDSLKNKQEELDLYYRSLIRYEYEKALINQKLDTTVSEKQILDYYNQSTESFILKRRVCKATYLVLTADIPKKDIAKEWLGEESTESIDSLQKYCIKYGAKFNLNANKWFYLDDLMSETLLPLSFEIEVTEDPLVFSDSLKTIMLKVKDLRLPGDPKPLSMTASTIRSIIKNKGKVEFINKMENDVLEKSKRSGAFEIYD